MNKVTIYIDRKLILPDGKDWINRFQIHSETSNRVYTIAQHKTHKHFGCSCPGWKIHRTCKHLIALGLPVKEVPAEIELRS